MFADLPARNDSDKFVVIDIPVLFLKACEDQAQRLNLSMNEFFTEAISRFLEIRLTPDLSCLRSAPKPQAPVQRLELC